MKKYFLLNLSQSISSLWRILAWIWLLSMIVAAGCTATSGQEQPADQVSGPPDEPSLAALETPLPDPPPAATALLPAETVEPVAAASDTLAPESAQPEPQIGQITFALDITEDDQPVEPNLIFTRGITEVHAIFTYSHMSPDYTWERVWYLNDREVSRTTSPWTGPGSGVFDYFIDNGGKPLPNGDWLLELFVEGELRSLGVFIIEEEVSSPAIK